MDRPVIPHQVSGLEFLSDDERIAWDGFLAGAIAAGKSVEPGTWHAFDIADRALLARRERYNKLQKEIIS